MAKKAFEIQGSDLKLGGVNLQAGTTGVVIPGVTQATNYVPDEVEDSGDQTQPWGRYAPIVIDYTRFSILNGDYTAPGSYEAATYLVEELDDDGYIDGDIEITDPGAGWNSVAANSARDNDMKAATPFKIIIDLGDTGQTGNILSGAEYSFPVWLGSFNMVGWKVYINGQDTGETVSDQINDTNNGNSTGLVFSGNFTAATDDWAFSPAGYPFGDVDYPFNANDWIPIPYRVKIRAGEVETIGGGGGIGDLGIGESGESINSDNGLSFIDFNENGDDNLVLGTNSSNNAVKVSLNEGAHEFTFNSDGSLTFPDGTIQTTAYTGQTGSGSSTGYIYIMANVDGDIVTSTDGVTWSDPTPSGMAGIDRVAVHGGVIVYAYSYVDGGDSAPVVPGLYYSTTIGTVELCTGTDVLNGDNLYWNQVRYFSEPDKWVAVGYFDTTPDEVPAVAYSNNGIDWTVVLADETFVADFNSDEYDWRLTDIAWISETEKYVITSNLDGPDWYGGIFITDDLTVALDASVHIAIDLNVKKVAPWSVTQFGGPPGYIMLWDDNDDDVVWSGWGTDPEDYSSGSEWWTDSVSQQIGYIPPISEVAYDEDSWVAVTDDGQVIIPIVTMGPPAYTVTVPLPYTTTDFSISRANPAVLTYNENNPELALKNNEKIVISGSDMFDGTYYYKESDDTLYTDQSLTTALDSSGFDPFVSGGTLTMSHGTYFDAAGTAGGYYYIGNDDEQVFRSTNGVTWTQLADVTGVYLNDFAYGTFTTEESGVSFVQLADGSLQAQASSLAVAALSSALTGGRPAWLSITPRSPDRETLDTHYGFNSTGMWFTGDNEETYENQPAYPIHSTASFPADAKAVITFNVNYVDGAEDWGVCVYPADGIPHWSWEQHPSRIAAQLDIGDAGIQINGFTDSSNGDFTGDPGLYTARFTYDPVAEMSTFELLDADDAVVSRCELPGRLERGQDYRIGFDADWDEAGPTDKSYFTNLSITVGETGVTKTTDFTITGEVKLPSTVKSFVNMAGPWINNDSDINFHTVATHDGFAYIGGEEDWDNTNHARLDKYSLTTGELVWSRVLGAGRNASFDISWTGGTYTIDSIANGGVGYAVNEILSIAGDSFAGGAFPSNNATITVTEVGDEGAIITATIAGTAPSGTDSTTGINPFLGDADGFALSVEYDTVNDNLVVLSYQNSILTSQAAVVRINPTNGDVVGNVTLTDEGDIYPYDVAVHPTTGATAVVGEKYNEYKEFGTLTMLATGDGYFDILKTELDEEHWPGNGIPSDPIGNFLISGTGITGTENVDYVNYYENVSGTTREGSGAEFTVIANDGDPGVYTVTVTSGGSYYLVGHQIKILGTSLGGTTPANDLILTVSQITPSLAVTASGSADGGAQTTYTEVTGTNYNVGSGMSLNINVDALTGSRIADLNLGGSNYVSGDVVIIAGTQFAGGASTANDVEVTITSIGDAGGNVTGQATAGTTPTNAIRIRVDGVDFTAVGGSWSMKQNLDGEAFVWTPDWNKAIGGGTYDKFESVVYSKDGDSIYTVGSGYYETSYSQSLVVKFATSDGAIEFSKYLNSENTNAYATSVATIGTSDIVVSGYEYRSGSSRDKQFVARMTSSGTVVWKKFYGEGSWGSSSLGQNSNIEVDSNDNIYVTLGLADDNPSWSNWGFTVTKLDSTGNILWTRCLSGNDSSYLGNSNGNRWSSLHGDQLVVVGRTNETNDENDNALWVSFPTDGFTYFGGEDDFVQMGAFRFGPGRIKDEGATEDVGGSFTPSVQPPNITAITDYKRYATRTPDYLFPQHLHKALDPKHGGLVFGDGTKQNTAGDRIPQIRADDDYYITVNDSGKHIYFRNNDGNVVIPGWWRVNLPVGFTFTIVNYTGSTCYVNLEWWPGEVGTILGAGRNISTPAWGIPDSGSGSMVTLIKLEDGHDYNNQGQQVGQVWMISGPSDIYNAD